MSPETTRKLVAATQQLNYAVGDILEALERGEIDALDTLGSHDSIPPLVDGVKLVLEAIGRPQDFEEIYAAACRLLQVEVTALTSPSPAQEAGAEPVKADHELERYSAIFRASSPTREATG